MQGIYHQSLTGNQGQLGPFDPSIIYINRDLKKSGNQRIIRARGRITVIETDRIGSYRMREADDAQLREKAAMVVK